MMFFYNDAPYYQVKLAGRKGGKCDSKSENVPSLTPCGVSMERHRIPLTGNNACQKFTTGLISSSG